MQQAEIVQKRIEEIRRLATERDLSRTSRRLLDFFAEVEAPVALRRTAIQLRAAYNAYAAQDHADALDVVFESLLGQAVDLIAEMEQACLPKGASANPGKIAERLPEKDREVVFTGTGITKVFKTRRYTFELPKMDVNLRLGEITGIVGENGNGKTTLMRIVAGDLEPTTGSIDYPLFGAEPGDWYAIKQEIAFIPQQLTPWRGFLKENLHFTAAIHGIKGVENEEQVDFVIHRLGLSQYEDAVWREISSGYKLRFELARALVWRPQLLIIDEPLGNLDINAQQIFLQDLRYLAQSIRYPMTILLSSQHLHEVESIADNIIFIKNGEALYNGKMQDFGQDRTENLFELSTDLTKTDIVARISHLEGVGVEDVGQVKVIHTPIGMDANQLLAELVRAGIPIHYFRDISTSTLKLFRRGAADLEPPEFPIV